VQQARAFRQAEPPSGLAAPRHNRDQAAKAWLTRQQKPRSFRPGVLFHV
jgi:hypothetical protein